MQILTWLLASLGQLAVTITQTLGYPGVAFLMALESTAVPLPSELILPFAGYLSASGSFNFWWIFISAAIGSLIGSLASYAMGYYGGKKVIMTFGRYCFLDEEDLIKTENWFKRRGEITILIARFVPVVRHLISLPAGLAKMDLKKFCLYTVIGASLWNLFLIWLGYILGQNWKLIRHYTEPFSIIIAGLIVIGAIAFIARHFWHKNKK